MATVLDMSNGNGTTKCAATPSSASVSETSGNSRRIQENGSAHPDASLKSDLLQPAPFRDRAPVELTALPPPPRPFEVTSLAPTIGFTSACGTVRAGGRTYPVVGHCAYGPIVVVERDVKINEEPDEEPADECSRRIYRLNPSPLFGIVLGLVALLMGNVVLGPIAVCLGAFSLAERRRTGTSSAARNWAALCGALFAIAVMVVLWINVGLTVYAVANGLTN